MGYLHTKYIHNDNLGEYFGSSFLFAPVIETLRLPNMSGHDN